jgi:hypothetical protein
MPSTPCRPCHLQAKETGLTATEQDSRPPLQVLADLAGAVADIHWLLLLDAAWTGSEQGSGDYTPADRATLATLGSRIDDELATLERHAVTLRNTFATYSAWVNASITRALASEHFTASFTGSQRSDIRRVLAAEDDDFAARGVVLAEDLSARVPREREEVGRKLRDLRGDGPIVTDIDHETACTIGALGGMGALACCVAFEQPIGCVAGGGILLVVIALC